MNALLRFLRLPLMAIGFALELMLIPIAWVVRWVTHNVYFWMPLPSAPKE